MCIDLLCNLWANSNLQCVFCPVPPGSPPAATCNWQKKASLPPPPRLYLCSGTTGTPLILRTVLFYQTEPHKKGQSNGVTIALAIAAHKFIANL